MQDNLEFLQWSKRFWDQNYPGGDYDAPSRRKGQSTLGGGGAPKEPLRTSATTKRGPTPTVGGGAVRNRTPVGGGGNNVALQNENASLKESVLGLEKERDFYFSKLRDIELLVQTAVEEQPELEQDPEGLIPSIQNILYSTEVGAPTPRTRT